MPYQKIVHVLDIEKLELEHPQRAVKTVDLEKTLKQIKCDVLIVGGGVGGVAAAIKLSAEHPALKVCLTEETSWLGGQMTAQGVSALDENYLIETSGACRSYQTFRKNVRAIYQSFNLSPTGKLQEFLNPGSSWVTYLAFEPKHALSVINEQLAPAINSGALQIFLRTKAVAVEKSSDKSSEITKLLAVNLDDDKLISFEPKICLDATELGDVLPLSGIPYRLGSDSQSDTGEKHTPQHGDRDNVQDYVFPFVVDFKPGTDNRIEKPPHFDEFNEAGKFSFNGYKMFEDSVLKDEGDRTVPPFWTYRRLIARENFDDPLFPFDVAMINWDSNDLRGYNIIDQNPSIQAERLSLAKSLSLGFLYWMQNSAPRDEGGSGYPELKLRTDVLGTGDGLSKYPYIREARRAIAKKTIVEQDIVASENSGARAKQMPDTLGIGLYPVDIHGKQEVPGAAQATRPFQIPYSALVPQAGGNVLPACKNIGVTHLTNGAYRLHPVEWAIGEAQAEVAAYCLHHHLHPAQVLDSKRDLLSIQNKLILGGSPCVWFDDVSTEDVIFSAVQYTTLRGLLALQNNSLNFKPQEPIKLTEVLLCLGALFDWDFDQATSNSTAAGGDLSGEKTTTVLNTARDPLATDLEPLISVAHEHGFLASITPADINSELSSRLLTLEQLKEIAKKSKFSVPLDIKNAAMGSHINRGQFAEWLYEASLRKDNR